MNKIQQVWTHTNKILNANTSVAADIFSDEPAFLKKEVEALFQAERLGLLDTIVGEAEDILQTERFSGVPIALNKLIERLQEAREGLKTKGE